MMQYVKVSALNPIDQDVDACGWCWQCSKLFGKISLSAQNALGSLHMYFNPDKMTSSIEGDESMYDHTE
jgi:hypothetical protein